MSLTHPGPAQEGERWRNPQGDIVVVKDGRAIFEIPTNWDFPASELAELCEDCNRHHWHRVTG